MADVSVTSASVLYVSGPTEQGIAAVDITAGDIVSSDWKLCDTNDAAASIRTMKGVALSTSKAGNPVTVAKPGAVVNMGATLAAGSVYVVSATPGKLAPVADLATGHYTTVAGIGLSAANMLVTALNGGVARP